MADRATTRGLVDPYGAVVFDIDGVLVRGNAALPGARDVLDALGARGVETCFVTNNARRTPDEIADWLGEAGLAVTTDRIVTSAHAAAALVAPGTRCLVIGLAGLREALGTRGCELDDDPDAAEAVVVGFDDTVCWDDLRRATTAIGRGARFVGTNGDTTLPVEDGLWPGNGAILAALEAATGVRPEIAGKPNPALFDAAAARLRGAPVLMVGDRVETDIAGAVSYGWDSALVLTGVSDREAAARPDTPPTYVVDTLADLLR